MEKIFNICDKDRDGKLSESELSFFMDQTGETLSDWNKELNEVISRA